MQLGALIMKHIQLTKLSLTRQSIEVFPLYVTISLSQIVFKSMDGDMHVV